MKKVLIMLNSLDLGGIEKAAVSLLKEMPAKDWEATLLMVRKQGVFLDEVPENIQIQEAGMPEDIRDKVCFSTGVLVKKYFRQGKWGLLGKTFLGALGRKGKSMDEIMESYFCEYDCRIPALEEEYDVAIDYQGQGTFPTYYIAKKVKAHKKLSWIHNDFSIVEQSVEWLRPLYSLYNQIISVSYKAGQAFKEKFPEIKEKSDICYNVLPVKEIMDGAEQFAVEKGKGFNIVTVGRLSSQKGYDVALKALSRLFQEGVDFKYTIVGEGEERANLEELIEELGLQDTVELAGFQKNPYPYIKMCDLYLQPSRFEGFCITLGEAKLLKKPIITTDFAGADEQVRDGEQGLIVRCSEEEIYRAVNTLLAEPAMMGKFIRNLDNEKIADDGLNKFRKLIGEG